MATSSLELLSAVRRHVLTTSALDFASSVFSGNRAIEIIELTITRDGSPDGTASIDVTHQSKQGFPLEGYSL